jgi:hypothetical protein
MFGKGDLIKEIGDLVLSSSLSSGRFTSSRYTESLMRSAFPIVFKPTLSFAARQIIRSLLSAFSCAFLFVLFARSAVIAGRPAFRISSGKGYMTCPHSLYHP